MASSDKDASCANDPDFAVICAFLEKFSEQLQVEYPDFKQLQDWLTNTDEVPNGLRDLHVKLMRKTRRTVHECAWEIALSKFCFSYSSQDGWEIERFGYKKSSLKVKLRILRELLESQFDRNNKFRAKILTMSADSLRSQPIGRDRLGHSYWLTQDLDCNLRIYQEHLDEEIWQVVATNRDELVKLISRLKGNEVVLPSEIGVVDEDSSSNSCSAAMVKPPPPEEKDDSQESNQSIEGRIPNIKIKLGSKENGVVVNGDSAANESEEKPHENGGLVKDSEKKVKPLVISQSKITMERSKKRSLDEAEKEEPEEVKKQRPSLLDSKREKKLSKYEKAKQEDDEDEQNEDEEDGEEECEEEEEDDSADEGEEEDAEEEGEGEDDVDGNVDGEDEVDEDDGEDIEDADDADDAEEAEDDDENNVGEEIEDPPLIVSEDGSGKECENGNNHFLAFAGLSDEPEFSEVIEETTLHVFGEGAGSECLVGNAKASENEPKATFFFGQPGCLKLSPVKTQAKVEDGDNHNDKKEEGANSTPEPANGENHTSEVEEMKRETTTAEQEHSAENPEAKNDIQSQKQPPRPSIINRKRRLSEDKPEKHTRHSSESETDINSEVAEEQAAELEESEDIGGKRIKMRSKSMNTDVRKKVEAQRQVTAVEETTSSSGEEERPRKKLSPKKIEREPEPILPLKAKLKQAAVAARAMEQQEQEEKKSAANKKPEDVEPTDAKVEVKDELEEKKPELEAVKEAQVEASTPSSPLKEAAEVKEEIEVPNESHNSPKSPAKHNKKSHPVELSEEVEEEVPKKKQSPGQSPRQSPEKNDLKEKERTPEKSEKKSPEPAPEGQSIAENQRKRRSSEDDSTAKQPTPPKSTVAPPVPVKTRTGRRGGPPEPVPELPQIKRTRVKASVAAADRAAKPDIKKATPPKTESAAKVKAQGRGVQNKAAIKQEVPKEEPIAAKEEPAAPEQNEVKTEEVKEEPKTDDASTPTKPLQKPTVTQRPRQQAAQKQPASGHRRKTHDAVDAKNIIDVDSEATPVRQSRRIAQLKIREEAERRKMEEIALRNMKAELKKKKKAEKAEDPTVSEPSEHSSDHAESEVEVKKKAEKKKKCPGKGGWSSGSEEPEEEEEEQYETDPGSPLFKSDHEFSPESELEDESQVVPLKRARTARKEGEEVVPTADADESCQKCGKSDHPEWILLCDKCDKGYHCSCLSPVIFYIPEGDWFCPPCQQEELIAALENHLKEFDNLVQCKKEEEEERLRLEMQERIEQEQAEQLKIEKKNKRKQVRKKKKGNSGGSGRHRTYRRKLLSDDSADESEENETETDASNSSKSNSSRGRSSRSQSESATDSDDEPIYKLRKRRQINVSYRLNEYDDMIKSALKEEEDEVAGAGNLGRGKDISTIIEADKEEKLRQQQLRIAEQNGEATEEADKPAANAAAPEDSGSDFEPLKRKPKGGRHLKKKSRKLTTLDISSEGDNDSDEDFKTSSMDDEEEDDEEEEDDAQSSDSSLDVYRRRGRGGKNKKKTRRAARRAARERRKDRRFIVDDSDGSEEEERPRSKKKRKKDSDYTETETNDDDDDELSENIDSDDLCDDSTESEASDGAWRPSKRKKQRSSTIARKSPKLKPKTSKPKKTKRVDDNNRSFKSGISKNRAIRDDSDDDDDDADSVDSSRRTRGKRCTYLEDYEDESSDGGIKPGVKRPDTPPEEREQFIKKQEEIKRMLAEKNAEGAKLAATPRLIPIKAGAQRSPAKLDPLSTVPLSVIRQAKVLDIDYLQRKGESISEGDLEESEFDDDDLPDDFNPEDMDEEEIARMVEEEDFAQQQLKLPPPAEVLRKKSSKELDTVLKPAPSFMGSQPQQSTSSSSSGLQEPVRKKLPMPTMHPPLLRHGFGAPSQQMLQQNRSSATPHLPLLQNALSAPPHNPMSRSFPPASQAIPATAAGMGSQPLSGNSSAAGGDPNKPRGRRKKITPLRDPLQKQQAAAAASAAAAAASKPRSDNLPPGKTEAKSPTIPVASGIVTTPGVIKSALSIAQPPQLYKPPPANTQPSVITRMPHVQGRPMIPVNGPPYAEQAGPRFYRQPQPQPQQQPPPPQGQSPGNVLIAGNRPPMRHRGPPMPPLPAHHSLRPSYVGGPPPLRPSSTAPPMSMPNDVRDQVQQRQSSSYSGSDQQYTPPPARHSAPPHLSPYRPQMFGNPGFPQRGPPTNSSQPSAIRTAGAPPEYASPGSFVGGYSYYPPPLSVPHSAPPPPTASAVPSSVIVSASSLAAASSSASSAAAAAAAAIPPQPPPTSAAAAPSRPPPPPPSLSDKPCVPAAAPVVSTKPATPSVIELSRKKLTTLETFNASKTVTPPPPLTESSESRSPYSSNPPTVGGVDDVPDDGSGSPPGSSQTTSEFSGLVSYFSSQHDDLNT